MNPLHSPCLVDFMTWTGWRDWKPAGSAVPMAGRVFKGSFWPFGVNLRLETLQQRPHITSRQPRLSTIQELNLGIPEAIIIVLTSSYGSSRNLVSILVVQATKSFAALVYFVIVGKSPFALIRPITMPVTGSSFPWMTCFHRS